MSKHRTSPAARSLLLGIGLLTSMAAKAQVLNIQFNLVAPNTFEYTVSNVSLGLPLKDFVVWFPEESGPGEYQNLTVLGSPSNWTGSAAEPTAISLNGYVEWNTGGEGIANGSSLGGFSVSFNNVGTSIPGSQYFKVYDDSFNEVASGWTTPVPEPAETAMASLLAAGIWVAGTRVYQARKRPGQGR